MSHEPTLADEYKAERDEFENEAITLRERVEELTAALRECADAISDELGACGSEEIKDHPILASHAKTLKRAHSVLVGK